MSTHIAWHKTVAASLLPSLTDDLALYLTEKPVELKLFFFSHRYCLLMCFCIHEL